MPTTIPNDVGDVHAPVEDIDVPFTLKLLVVLMVIILIGLGVLIGVIMTQPTIFSG